MNEAGKPPNNSTGGWKMVRLVLSSALLGLLILSGGWVLIWGPRPTDLPPSAKGRTVIRYWEKWTNFEGDAIRKIVDEYNAGQGVKDNIFVQYLSMSAIDQKIMVAIAAGDPPDVAGLWDHEVAPLAALGVTRPLDDLAKDAPYGEKIDANFYKPIYWQVVHYRGQLHALISTPAMVALFYNKKIFHDEADKLRAAGCDPDSYPKSIDELTRYAHALDEFKIGSDGKQHMVRAGYLPMEPGWWVYNTPIWFGPSFIWDDKLHKFNLTTPAAIKAFDWVQSFSKVFGEDAITEFTNSVQNQFNSPSNPFMVGQVCMVQQGPWFANYIYQNVHNTRPEFENEWAACPFPSDDGRQMVSWAATDTLAIPMGSKHPKEAFKFMCYINRQDVMEELCMAHCKNSPLMKVSDNFIKNHPNHYIQLFEDLARSPNAFTNLDCPIAEEMRDEMNAGITEMVLMKDTPEHIMDNMQTKLQAAADDFYAKQKKRFGS